ncbi:MAG: indole-3-glycerol phosphate synthase TrpC [Robiginitomaculum sp.]|nr:indole-3-glycerol phosphate synthase TrpC [Robiginitomaculum sp.]
MSVLDKIVADKHCELLQEKIATPLAVLQQQVQRCPPVRGFKNAILNSAIIDQPALIAEIKKASPSKGLIRENFQPAEHAISYKLGGASCLSVLTNSYFMGSDEHFINVRAVTELPMLRKEFIIDPWQIYQSKILGADCVLLIMAILSTDKALQLYQTCIDLDLDVLVEVHNSQELQRALLLPDTCMIGINNRNLHDFSTDLNTTANLLATIDSSRIVISESGIKTAADVNIVATAGVKGILVGESLMRHQNIQAATKKLLSVRD